MARRWAGAPAVRLRRRPVRRWSTPRHRHRGRVGLTGGCPRVGERVVLGQRPGERDEHHDSNLGRVLGHAHASWLGKRSARLRCPRGRPARDDRPKRNCRARRPVRPSRRPPLGGSERLRRSLALPAGEARAGSHPASTSGPNAASSACFASPGSTSFGSRPADSGARAAGRIAAARADSARGLAGGAGARGHCAGTRTGADSDDGPPDCVSRALGVTEVDRRSARARGRGRCPDREIDVVPQTDAEDPSPGSRACSGAAAVPEPEPAEACAAPRRDRASDGSRHAAAPWRRPLALAWRAGGGARRRRNRRARGQVATLGLARARTYHCLKCPAST